MSRAETLQSATRTAGAGPGSGAVSAGKNWVAPEVLETSRPFGLRILNPASDTGKDAGATIPVCLVSLGGAESTGVQTETLQRHAHRTALTEHQPELERRSA